MDYFFKLGQRVTVPVSAMSANLHQHFATMGAQRGCIVDEMPGTGTRTVDGFKRDRVRVKLDAWPRPLIFDKADISPVREG